MPQAVLTDTNSTTTFDDSNFPIADSFNTYIQADVRGSKDTLLTIKNTSNNSIEIRILGSTKPGLTIPDITDDSWEELITGASASPNGLTPITLPSIYSWIIVQLKNIVEGQIATAKVWLKAKL